LFVVQLDGFDESEDPCKSEGENDRIGGERGQPKQKNWVESTPLSWLRDWDTPMKADQRSCDRLKNERCESPRSANKSG